MKEKEKVVSVFHRVPHLEDLLESEGIAPRILIVNISGFGCLEVACWPLLPKFAGSHLAGRSRRIFRAKISSARLPSEIPKCNVEMGI